jgi:cysteine synthase A
LQIVNELRLKQPWSEVGKTRLIRVSTGIYAKLETENPTGSVKDRPTQYIVKKALASGEIVRATTLVEASSGNTGISLCAIGASLGLPVKIIMPMNMSEERKQMMRLFGATIIDAPPSDFLTAIQMRDDLVGTAKNHWSPMQFENPMNIQCHRETTAREIFEQLPKNTKLDSFFSGAGTGGTLMGFREACLERHVHPKCMLVVPAEPSAEHGIQGINDGADFLVNRDLMNDIHPIKTSHAIKRAKDFAKSHGVLVGISSGANLLAAENYVKKNDPLGAVVTILCDRGERYLSVF